MYIKIAKIYDRYTGYRKEYAVIGEVLTYSQFRKQLLHSDIMIQSNVQHKFKGKNDKCYLIDYQLLSSRCEVSGFENQDEIPPLN